MHPTSVPSSVPKETESEYSTRIHGLLESEDFASLEALAQANRIAPGYLVGGIWKRFAFYNALAYPNPVTNGTAADYQHLIEKVNKWKALYPRSSAALITLGFAYVTYADLARGDNFPQDLNGMEKVVFDQRIKLAVKTLLEAAPLEERDPHWYFVMICAGYDAGWDKSVARELMDQALAIEPDNYHFYRAYSMFVPIQNQGNAGDVLALAQEALAKHSGPSGPILYFHIVSSLTCYGTTMDIQLVRANWQLLRQGYASLQSAYGVSEMQFNRFAAMATLFKDKASAREAFGHITQPDHFVWPHEKEFYASREWANSDN